MLVPAGESADYYVDVVGILPPTDNMLVFGSIFSRQSSDNLASTTRLFEMGLAFTLPVYPPRARRRGIAHLSHNTASSCVNGSANGVGLLNAPRWPHRRCASGTSDLGHPLGVAFLVCSLTCWRYVEQFCQAVLLPICRHSCRVDSVVRNQSFNCPCDFNRICEFSYHLILNL